MKIRFLLPIAIGLFFAAFPAGPLAAQESSGLSSSTGRSETAGGQARGQWRSLPLVTDGKIDAAWAQVGWGGFVVDGDALRTACDDRGMGLLFYKPEKFGDCQIRVVYRCETPKSNSGVFVRIDDGIPAKIGDKSPEVHRDAKGKLSRQMIERLQEASAKHLGGWYPVHHGYEVQIQDDNDPLHRTGAIYSLARAAPAAAKPQSAWRTMIITLRGQRIMVEVDGKRLSSFDPEAASNPPRKNWTEPMRELKRPTHGYIGLQNHDPGDVVWFREVSLRPLDRAKDMKAASAPAKADSSSEDATIDAREFVRRQLQFLEAKRDRLVIDADVHPSDVARLTPKLRERYDSSPDYYHGRPVSAEDVLAEMRMAEVDMALVWQNPATTVYTGDTEENYQALLAANRYILQISRKYPTKFIPAGWVDPKACGLDRSLKLVATLIRDYGFAVVKMNPAQNRFPIDSEPALRLVDRIVELGGIPAFHYGADTPFTPAEGLARVAKRHPAHPVLAVHMGGGGAGYVEAEGLYQASRRLGLAQPNVYFVLSARRDTHTESDLIAYQLAGEPFCRHLCCGSDAPYGRMAWNFGGYRWMFKGLLDGANHIDPRLRSQPGLFTPDAVHNYLGRNLADLMIAGYRRLLKGSDARTESLPVTITMRQPLLSW